METVQSQKVSRGSSQRGKRLLSLLSERTMSVGSVVSDTKGPREEAWRRGVIML